MRMVCVGVIGLGLLSAQVAADMVSLAPNLDNTLYQSATGSLSNAKGQHLFSGLNGSGIKRRAVLSFDVAGSIPAGSTITGATLTVNVSSGSTGFFDISLYRTLASWGEGTSAATGAEGNGAPSTPGDATWTHRFFDTTNWATAGGDFDPTSRATTSIGPAGTYAWTSTALMVADVQSWLDAPGGNFGWLVSGGEDSAGSAKRFGSRENVDPAQRPVLTVTYVVPSPATIFLSLGTLAVATRRGRTSR
ncbi:MAG: DNRLRE domain-containing protein [Phycisphaerae bacterium]|nr:DNRLRE domain-containing protein [Phycisphaerae bacterium]